MELLFIAGVTLLQGEAQCAQCAKCVILLCFVGFFFGGAGVGSVEDGKGVDEMDGDATT